MDGAGADDDKNSVIVACQNSRSTVASGSDGLLRDRRRNDLVTKQSRLDEGVVLKENRVRNERGEEKYASGGDGRTPITRRS